jgi:hypothetical protein
MVAKDEKLRAKIESVRIELKSMAQTAGNVISRGPG